MMQVAVLAGLCGLAAAADPGPGECKVGISQVFEKLGQIETCCVSGDKLKPLVWCVHSLSAEPCRSRERPRLNIACAGVCAGPTVARWGPTLTLIAQAAVAHRPRWPAQDTSFAARASAALSPSVPNNASQDGVRTSLSASSRRPPASRAATTWCSFTLRGRRAATWSSRCSVGWKG